jgi:hypothetical protein
MLKRHRLARNCLNGLAHLPGGRAWEVTVGVSHLRTGVRALRRSDMNGDGAAKIDTGTLLIVEGLTGELRSGTQVEGAKNKRHPGLAASLFTTALLAVLLVMSLAGADEHRSRADDPTTAGTIVDYAAYRDARGEVQYQGIYAYEVDGNTYFVAASVTLSTRPTIGSKVQISYPADNPQDGVRTDGLEGDMPRILPWAYGAFLLLFGSTLLVNIGLVVVGAMLIVKGRREQGGPTGGGAIKDLLHTYRSARHGDT